jgi:hypothetical protein
MPGAAFLYTFSTSCGARNDGDNDVEGARKPLRVTLHLRFCTNCFLHFTPQGARAHSTNAVAVGISRFHHVLCARVLRHEVRTTTQMHRVSAREVLLSTIVITTTRALHHKTTRPSPFTSTSPASSPPPPPSSALRPTGHPKRLRDVRETQVTRERLALRAPVQHQGTQRDQRPKPAVVVGGGARQ